MLDKPRLAVVPAVATLVGCSALLDYDAVSFDSDAGRKDASVAGSGGAAVDASWEATAGSAGSNGGASQGGAAGTSGGASGGAAGGASGTGGEAQAGAGGAAPTCDGIDCGAHGACVVDGGGARCQCDSGYHPEGFTCVADPSCDGITCSNHGTCFIYGGKPVCQCETGYHAQGDQCIANATDAACQNVDCGGHGACLVDPLEGARCHCDVGYYLAHSRTNCVAAAGSKCDGVSCGGFGTCWVQSMFATCSCDPGYMPYAGQCIPEGKLGCRDIDDSFVLRSTRRCSADDTHMEVCWDGNGDGIAEWVDGQVTCPNGEKCSVCITRPCLAAGYPGKECPAGETCVPCPIGTQCVPEAHSQPIYVCMPKCDCTNCPNCEDSSYFIDWQEYCGNPNASPATMACKVPCPMDGDGCLPWGANSICWGMEGCFSAAP